MCLIYCVFLLRHLNLHSYGSDMGDSGFLHFRVFMWFSWNSQLPLILHTHTTLTYTLLLGGWQSLSLFQASPSTRPYIQERWPSSPDHQRVNHDWSGPIQIVLVPLTMIDLGWTYQPILANGTWEKVSWMTSANKVNGRSSYCSLFVKGMLFSSNNLLGCWVFRA